MSTVGIIAAFPGELKPLTRGWEPLVLPGFGKGDVAWRGRIGRSDCVALATGMGADAAARGCGLAETAAASNGGLAGLVSAGWAGALSCGLAAGHAYLPVEVIDAGTGERFRTSQPDAGGAALGIVSIDHVASVEEKRELGKKFGAVLVDMEAAAVARAARSRQIFFLCCKAVSDLPNEQLPDFAAYAGAQGKLNMPALVAFLLRRPRYWRPLIRVGRNSRAGAAELAAAIRAHFDPR